MSVHLFSVGDICRVEGENAAKDQEYTDERQCEPQKKSSEAWHSGWQGTEYETRRVKHPNADRTKNNRNSRRHFDRHRDASLHTQTDHGGTDNVPERHDSTGGGQDGLPSGPTRSAAYSSSVCVGLGEAAGAFPSPEQARPVSGMHRAILADWD